MQHTDTNTFPGPTGLVIFSQQKSGQHEKLKMSRRDSQTEAATQERRKRLGQLRCQYQEPVVNKKTHTDLDSDEESLDGSVASVSSVSSWLGGGKKAISRMLSFSHGSSQSLSGSSGMQHLDEDLTDSSLEEDLLFDNDASLGFTNRNHKSSNSSFNNNNSFLGNFVVQRRPSVELSESSINSADKVRKREAADQILKGEVPVDARKVKATKSKKEERPRENKFMSSKEGEQRRPRRKARSSNSPTASISPTRRRPTASTSPIRRHRRTTTLDRAQELSMTAREALKDASTTSTERPPRSRRRPSFAGVYESSEDGSRRRRPTRPTPSRNGQGNIRHASSRRGESRSLRPDGQPPRAALRPNSLTSRGTSAEPSSSRRRHQHTGMLPPRQYTR